MLSTYVADTVYVQDVPAEPCAVARVQQQLQVSAGRGWVAGCARRAPTGNLSFTDNDDLA